MATPKGAWLLLSFAVVAVALACGPALAASSLSVSTSDVTSTSARVTWTQTSDWCFAQYRVQDRPLGSGGWGDEHTIASASTTSTTLTGLHPGTAYEVRVVDEDCMGSQPSATWQFTTAAPVVQDGSTAVGFYALVALVVIAFVAIVIFAVRSSGKVEPANVAAFQSATPVPSSANADVARFCSHCGAPLAGPFCNACGQRNE